MRSTITIVIVVAGFVLQAVSFLLWAAPLGVPTSPAYSDPRVPFASTFFIIGVILVFLAAVVYELVGLK